MDLEWVVRVIPSVYSDLSSSFGSVDSPSELEGEEEDVDSED